MAARNLSLAQPTLLTSLFCAAVVLSKVPSSVVAEEETERKAPTAAIADASSPPALGEWKQWRAAPDASLAVRSDEDGDLHQIHLWKAPFRKSTRE